MRFYIWMTIVCASVVSEISNDVESRLVLIKSGPVSGYKDPQEDVFVFYGIPYAKAPTGSQRFKDQYLEEMTKEQLAIVNKSSTEDPIVKTLEKIIEGLRSKEKQSIKKFADRFVIEKFNGKNMNVYHWMEVFEKECARFNLEKDEEKIKIFRLFLEKLGFIRLFLKM